MVHGASKLEERSKYQVGSLASIRRVAFSIKPAYVAELTVFGACGMRQLTSSMGDHVCIRCHMAFVAQTCPGSQSKWNSLIKSLAGQIHDPDQTQSWQDLP